MSEHAEVCFDAEALHQATLRAYAHGKALLANGENVRVACGPALEPISIQQRRFLHGPVLGQISEQIRIGGERYVIETWKEYFRKLFLGDRWEMVRMPKWDHDAHAWTVPKNATPRRMRVSTEELGVKGYAEFTDKVIDYATLEWGVVFHFTHEEQQLRARKPGAPKT